MIQIDETNHHVMQTSLLNSGSSLLLWPKDTPTKWLVHLREVVNLQLDALIKASNRKSAKEMSADAEYESWFSAGNKP